MARQGLTALVIGAEGADLADEIGLAEVTISQVARRLGVKVPSLYAHLAGSEELMLWIAATSLDDLADLVAAELVGRSRQKAVTAYGDAVRRFAQEHPGRYQATRQRVGGEGEAARAALAAGRRHSELIAAVLRGYAVEGEDAVHATRLIGSVVHGFVSLESAGAFEHSRPPSEESWQRALAVLADTLSSYAER